VERGLSRLPKLWSILDAGLAGTRWTGVLKVREWLAADRFTVADLLMADALRVEKVRSFGDRPATESYVTRITERPSFKKAHADQLAHFAKAD
jgi:glutathione S-transferase